MKKQIQKRLDRVMADLDWMAGRLEDNGFDSHQTLLDAAADKVELVQESLAAL